MYDLKDLCALYDLYELCDLYGIYDSYYLYDLFVRMNCMVCMICMNRKAVRTDRAAEGDIVRASLDSAERRLVLASSCGEIVIYGFLQVRYCG